MDSGKRQVGAKGDDTVCAADNSAHKEKQGKNEIGRNWKCGQSVQAGAVRLLSDSCCEPFPGLWADAQIWKVA